MFTLKCVPLRQTLFKKSWSSQTSFKGCLWLQTTLNHWQIPLTRLLMSSQHSNTPQDTLLPQPLLTVRRCRHTLHLSHNHQSCSQFPPTPRLPLRHQGRCLLSQRQLLLQPKGCFQILCLLLVTSTRARAPSFSPCHISCPKGDSYSCEGIDPFQKGCSLLWAGIRRPYGGAPGGAWAQAPRLKKAGSSLNRQLSSQLRS